MRIIRHEIMLGDVEFAVLGEILPESEAGSDGCRLVYPDGEAGPGVAIRPVSFLVNDVAFPQSDFESRLERAWTQSGCINAGYPDVECCYELD